MIITSGSSTDDSALSQPTRTSPLHVSSTLLPCICAVSCPRHNIAIHDILDNIPALADQVSPDASTTAVGSGSTAPSSASSTTGYAASTISSVSTATATSGDAESVETIWRGLDGLVLEEHVAPDASPMRRSGFLRDGEYGEDEVPNLSHIAMPVWVVWQGHDGRQRVHGVYSDWGRAGQVTQGVSNARHMRYDSRDSLFADWRDAHLGVNGQRAIAADSHLWSGSLLGRVVTRAELVERIRAHAIARDIDPDNDAATSATVSSILLDAIVAGPHPLTALPRNTPSRTTATSSTSAGGGSDGDDDGDAGFYVVIRGRHPGLWYSRKQYLHALGHHRKRWGYVAPTEARAGQFLNANEDKMMTL